MRKFLAIIIIGVLFLSSCTLKGASPGTPSPTTTAGAVSPSPKPAVIPEARVTEFFPLNKDVHMKYKGTGNEYAAFETYVDYVKNNTVQLRSMNGGTVSAIVYKLENGSLKRTFTRGETYYRYDYTAMNRDEEILIKEPIKQGTSWTVKDGYTRTITAVDKEIATPAGTYKALEVTTKSADSTIRDYYAKNIGLIKTEFASGSEAASVVSELEKIERGVPLVERVRIYFPEFDKDRVVYIDRSFSLLTNEDIISRFQTELKSIPVKSGLSRVLSQNTRILAISLDDEKGLVKVDFSSELIKEMNAGSSLEGMLIKSITNTFGDYFGKDKVYISIEGKPYESGHIKLNPGEFFTVSKENTAEYR